MAERDDSDTLFETSHLVRELQQQATASAVHGWCMEAIQEGVRVNRADPAYEEADATIAYITGAGPRTDRVGPPGEKEVRKVFINLIKRAVREHVSALTDIRPLFSWRTKNKTLESGANVLNQYSVIWWVNSFADFQLADAVRWALIGGAGDIEIQYDPNFLGGDSRLIARDWRNTIPIRPSNSSSQSIQEWEGVILRDRFTGNRLRARFPEKAHLIRPDSGKYTAFTSYLPKELIDKSSRFGMGPPSTLSGLGDQDPNREKKSSDLVPQSTLFRLFLHDRTRNHSTSPLGMGNPGTNWAYSVPPLEPLYPNGRYIMFTEEGILYDGPSPYWSGPTFPLARLRLDPWPFLFVGLGLCHELKDINDAVNFLVNDMLRISAKQVDPSTWWDKNMPESVKRRFDARKPGEKVRRPNNFQKGVEYMESPDVPQWVFPLLQGLLSQFDILSGSAGLQALMQLRQMPGKETMEKFTESLTPHMRIEGRQIELVLRDVAHCVKSNFFQFQSKAKTFSVIGDSGVQVDDLDYDPDSDIPIFDTGSPEAKQVPELSADRPFHERARFFSNQFAFYVAPSSMLSFHATERKLLYLQLSRQGLVDIWSLAEVLEIPNMGTPPFMLLPTLDQDQIKAALDSGTPPPNVYRLPSTIIERLMAQNQLGVGQTVSPAGRKATGQSMPTMKQRGDGSPIVSESEGAESGNNGPGGAE